MVEIIQPNAIIQPTGSQAVNLSGIGGVFDALGKNFADQLTPEVKRRQIEVLRGKATTQDRENAGVDALSLLARSGNYDPNAAAAEGIRAGLAPGNVAGYDQYLNVKKFGAGSREATDATMSVPGASYGSTVQGKNAELANARTLKGMEEGTKLRVAAQTPQTVLQANEAGDMVPTIVRQDQSYGKPASVSNEEQRGALLRQNFKNLDGLDPSQQKALGAQPTSDQVYNYVSRNPDGSVTQGRSLDAGKTDAITGKPLAASAQLVSPSNAGGSAAFGQPGGLDQTMKNRLIPARDAHSQVVDLAGRLKTMVTSDPTIVGPAGNLQRSVQYAMDTGNGVAKLFGSQEAFEKQFSEAARVLQASGVKEMPGVMFNPKASAVGKLNTILVYKAAGALAGQSGRDISDHDVKRVTSMVGDPESWFEGPQRYAAGLDTIIGESTRGMNSIDQQLNASNIAPKGLAPPVSASNPATAESVLHVDKEGDTATDASGKKAVFTGGQWVVK